MSGIQTILTFAAFFMLITAALNFNRALVESDITITQGRYRMEALSIADAYAHEASQFVYDEITMDTSISNILANMTPESDLGLDLSDGGIIDDFDDYHTMTISDTGRSGVPFQLNFNVEYVTLQGDTFANSAGPEYHKRMTISIYDNNATPYIYKLVNGLRVKDTLNVSFVHSYWFYN